MYIFLKKKNILKKKIFEKFWNFFFVLKIIFDAKNGPNLLKLGKMAPIIIKKDVIGLKLLKNNFW